MADVERQVRIAFEGDDRISPVIDTINGKINSFASSVQGVTGPLADMAAAVLKTEAAFAALAVGGIVLSVKAAGDFDTKFREIQSLFEASPEQVGLFKTALLDFASSSLTPLDQVAAATYEAISAGIDWTKSIEFMSQAERLNVAGKGELQSTTLALAGVINAYGGDVSKAADYSDVLFETVKIGNVVLPQLADGMGKVVSIAAAGGVPFSDLSAAVAALTSYGVPAEEAMTAVQRAIISIISPSEEAKKQAEALGIKFDATALQANGLQGMLNLIYEKTGGNVDQINNLIPRVEGLVAVLSLGKDAGGKYVEALAAMEERSGAVARAYTIMAESFDKVNQRIVNSLQSTLIAIGMPLLDEYAQIGSGISAIFSNIKIEVNKGTFDPVLNLIQEFGNTLAIDLQAIAKAMPEAFAGVDWSKLTESIKNVGDSVVGLFKAAFGDIDLTTVSGLQAAIQKVVDGIAALNNVTAGILKSWEPFVRALAEAATSFSESDEGTQKLTGSILGFGQAIDKVLSFTGAFTGAMNVLSGSIGLLALTHVPSAIAAFGALGVAGELVAAAIGTLGVAAAAVAAGWTLDKVLGATIPLWAESRDAMAETALALTGASEATGEWIGATEQAAVAATETTADLEALAKQLFEIPDQKQITFDAINRASPEFQEILKEVQAIPFEKTTTVTAQPDMPSIQETKNIIITELPDGVIVLTQLNPDRDSIDRTKSALGTIPDKKLVEMRLEGDIEQELAKVKLSAELVQKSMEWKAKIELASIEETQKTLRAFSDNTTKMFLDTGDVINTALGQLTKLEGLDKYHLEDLIAAESKRRDELLVSQIKMNDFQMEYIKQRTDALRRGDSMISISAEGLAPELTLVLHKIVELAQIKANEEGLAFLLGVTA